MAPGQKAYPRGTVKKIIKAHSNCNLSKNVDVMIYLDYVLFMQTLVKEAAIESKKSGERGITARSVKKVTSGLNTEIFDERSDPARNTSRHKTSDLSVVSLRY
ncbi:inner kinetochore subunit wip1 [Colletotrichum liriopes]|uniref:Inner kinetochore subunit wip1 n=1 Tax=Colletotrichum liriopes TaxID=708192 RepID=A0AA37LSY8_9PEZI|nr:inner kinetochore subunit wip1 [Colletotrichum liriopes]